MAVFAHVMDERIDRGFWEFITQDDVESNDDYSAYDEYPYRKNLYQNGFIFINRVGAMGPWEKDDVIAWYEGEDEKSLTKIETIEEREKAFFEDCAPELRELTQLFKNILEGAN